MRRKRRIMLAVMCMIAVAALIVEPVFPSVYAKSYEATDLRPFAKLKEGDELIFPEWGDPTKGMDIRYFSEKNDHMRTINVEPGENYVIPSYDSLGFYVEIPEGKKFASWEINSLPTPSNGGLQWDLHRVLEDVTAGDVTPAPTVEPTEAPVPTPIVTVKPTEVPVPTPTATVKPTEAPVPTPIVTVKPTEAPVPTPIVTVKPTEAPVPTPTATVKPIEAPVPTPTPTATVKPTEAPVPTPIVTVKPTETPVPAETVKPTETPVPVETVKPGETPAPTVEPPIPTPMSIVISHMGVYELNPISIYSLGDGISHVDGDITNYAASIDFTVEAEGVYIFY